MEKITNTLHPDPRHWVESDACRSDRLACDQFAIRCYRQWAFPRVWHYYYLRQIVAASSSNAHNVSAFLAFSSIDDITSRSAKRRCSWLWQNGANASYFCRNDAKRSSVRAVRSARSASISLATASSTSVKTSRFINADNCSNMCQMSGTMHTTAHSFSSATSRLQKSRASCLAAINFWPRYNCSRFASLSTISAKRLYFSRSILWVCFGSVWFQHNQYLQRLGVFQRFYKCVLHRYIK